MTDGSTHTHYIQINTPRSKWTAQCEKVTRLGAIGTFFPLIATHRRRCRHPPPELELEAKNRATRASLGSSGTQIPVPQSVQKEIRVHSFHHVPPMAQQLSFFFSTEVVGCRHTAISFLKSFFFFAFPRFSWPQIRCQRAERTYTRPTPRRHYQRAHWFWLEPHWLWRCVVLAPAAPAAVASSTLGTLGSHREGRATSSTESLKLTDCQTVPVGAGKHHHRTSPRPTRFWERSVVVVVVVVGWNVGFHHSAAAGGWNQSVNCIIVALVGAGASPGKRVRPRTPLTDWLHVAALLLCRTMNGPAVFHPVCLHWLQSDDGCWWLCWK